MVAVCAACCVWTGVLELVWLTVYNVAVTAFLAVDLWVDIARKRNS